MATRARMRRPLMMVLRCWGCRPPRVVRLAVRFVVIGLVRYVYIRGIFHVAQSQRRLAGRWPLVCGVRPGAAGPDGKGERRRPQSRFRPRRAAVAPAPGGASGLAVRGFLPVLLLVHLPLSSTSSSSKSSPSSKKLGWKSWPMMMAHPPGILDAKRCMECRRRRRARRPCATGPAAWGPRPGPGPGRARRGRWPP